MPAEAYDGKHDESDDFGMPIYHAGRPNPNLLPIWSLRRLKRYAPFLGCVLLAIAYWTWPESLTRTNWSKYAYVTYATDEHNLCNALMVFESLHRLGSKADRVMLHNPQWASTSQGAKDRPAQMLHILENKYDVVLKPVQMLDERGETTLISGEHSTWDTSITKLRAFELTEYERVLAIDSDVTVLQNMDELFLLPKAPVAMPRAYWSDGPSSSWPFTSLLVLLEPSKAELKGMLETLRSWWMEAAKHKELNRSYDMELLNHRFGSSAMVLPHRPYALLSAEFRNKNHDAYLGTINAPQELKGHFDPDEVLKEAKLVHFSDWPLPKPWIMWPYNGLAEVQPNCTAIHGDKVYTCRERDVWKHLYDDFRERRKDVCRTLSVSAPDWNKHKQAVGAAPPPPVESVKVEEF